MRALLNPRLIENVFMVEEYAFDATKLASWAEHELKECGVQIRFKTHVTAISNGPNGTLQVNVQPDHGAEELISCHYLFNCTYSGLNQFKGDFPGTQTGLKQEITEMALMQVPLATPGLG